MTHGLAHGLVGFAAFLVVAAFIVFAFWQGLKIKPDHNNRDNWDRLGGPPDSHDGHGF